MRYCRRPVAVTVGVLAFALVACGTEPTHPEPFAVQLPGWETANPPAWFTAQHPYWRPWSTAVALSRQASLVGDGDGQLIKGWDSFAWPGGWAVSFTDTYEPAVIIHYQTVHFSIGGSEGPFSDSSGQLTQSWTTFMTAHCWDGTWHMTATHRAEGLEKTEQRPSATSSIKCVEMTPE